MLKWLSQSALAKAYWIVGLLALGLALAGCQVGGAPSPAGPTASDLVASAPTISPAAALAGAPDSSASPPAAAAPVEPAQSPEAAAQAPGQVSPPSGQVTLRIAPEMVKGRPDAPVILVDFSDFR